MKKFFIFMLLGFTVSCSSVRLTDSWTSGEYAHFQPKKVLVVGITQNLTARKVYEEQLKKELMARGITAEESYEVFEKSFTASRQTEEEIEKQFNQLASMGFDGILISTVKGVEDEVSYSGGYGRVDHFWRRFHGYYLVYQDVYFNPGYYEVYKIYTIESSLYNVDADSEKNLVWVASFDMVDPKGVNKPVKGYVKSIIKAMEKNNLIPRKVSN